MSLQIIKSGIMDTLQDRGRYGYQHRGINPGGVMDAVSATIANALTGNDNNEAVIELHFPAATFFFRKPALIAITGADFSAAINGAAIPLLQPVLINENSTLQFRAVQKGARAYLSVYQGFQVAGWLGSCSTNTKIPGIGFLGRALQKDDELYFHNQTDFSPLLKDKSSVILPWRAGHYWNGDNAETVYVLPGNEWEMLDAASQTQFTNQSYVITRHSDRMGYALQSGALSMTIKEELISTAVSFGTLQLLPDGQLMLLAADHQTTGGYPRIAHVIKAHRHRLAQAKADNVLHFCFIDQQTAEQLFVTQQQQLLRLQQACDLRLQEAWKVLSSTQKWQEPATK